MRKVLIIENKDHRIKNINDIKKYLDHNNYKDFKYFNSDNILKVKFFKNTIHVLVDDQFINIQ